jgi:sugar transferase (PEP-CTERM/EpsH1 system associated)
MKKHIAHIVYSLQIGGLEELVLNLVRKMDRSRYQLSVIVLREDGPLSLEMEKLGITVHRLHGREGFSVQLIRQLAALLRQHNVDAVHTHDLGPFIYGGLASLRNLNRNVFHTEHSYLSQNSRRLMMFERALGYYCRVIIADSRDVAAMLIERQKIPSRKVVTILNGIDLDRFRNLDTALVRRTLGIQPNTFVIGTVGRLVPVKNQALLIKAFARFAAEQPAELVIVGDGQERQALESLAAELGVASRVHFTGARRDIPSMLASLDLFVLPSLSEGLSLTLLEAMAAARPVIATHVGGNPEVISDGKNGLLVPSDHVEKLTEAICRMNGANMAWRDTLASTGRRTVEDQFSLDSMVRAYVQLYDRYIR